MEFMAMGGYGVYVWSSFGLMFAVVIITIVQARVRHHAMLREIKIRIEAMEIQQ